MKKLLLVTLLAGCTTSVGFDKFNSLVDKGILPLSSDNAYVGSNLFIAEEAEKSSQLFNFLKGRGGPAAIELVEDSGAAPTLYMYYPKEREVYAAELVLIDQDQSQFREWLVRGPFGIERKDFRELTRLETSFISEPLFVVKDREIRFRTAPREESLTSVLIPTVPTPAPTPKRVVRKDPKKEDRNLITQKGDEGTKTEPLRPINSDQQAILQAKGFSERADNGDLLHTVKSGEESLKKIAAWYTGTDSTTGEVAKSSGITDPNAPLALGAKIRIPANLVKNNRPYILSAD